MKGFYNVIELQWLCAKNGWSGNFSVSLLNCELGNIPNIVVRYIEHYGLQPEWRQPRHHRWIWFDFFLFQMIINCDFYTILDFPNKFVWFDLEFLRFTVHSKILAKRLDSETNWAKWHQPFRRPWTILFSCHQNFRSVSAKLMDDGMQMQIWMDIHNDEQF